MGRILFGFAFLVTAGCLAAAPAMNTLEGTLICLGCAVLLGATLASRARQLLAIR